MTKDPKSLCNPHSRYHSEVAWNEIALDTWIDESTGLIWLPREPSPSTYAMALKGQNKRKRLPNLIDWEQASRHGMRRFLPDIEGFWYWSSTKDDVTDQTWCFSGSSGRMILAPPEISGMFFARYIKRLE